MYVLVDQHEFSATRVHRPEPYRSSCLLVRPLMSDVSDVLSDERLGEMLNPDRTRFYGTGANVQRRGPLSDSDSRVDLCMALTTGRISSPYLSHYDTMHERAALHGRLRV